MMTSIRVVFILVFAVVQLCIAEYVSLVITDLRQMNPNQCHHPLITQLSFSIRRHSEIEFTLKWTLCIVNWMLIIQHHEEILEIQCGFTSRNWGTNFDHHSAKLLSRLLIWCGSATAARHYSEIKVTFPIWCTIPVQISSPAIGDLFVKVF